MGIIKYFLKKISRDKNNYSRGIVTILSNKGGVGKTSLAICLAIAYSEYLGKKTLLLELDCSPGDIGLIMDVADNKSIDFLFNDRDITEKYFKKYSQLLDVIKGFQDPITAERIREKTLKDFLKDIKNKYEIIIIDTQTVLNGMAVDALRSSDEIILISDFTFESLSRIKRLYELLIKKFLIDKAKFRLIMNKKRLFSLLRPVDINSITDLPALSYIPFDRKFDKFLFLANKVSAKNTRFFKNVNSLSESLLKSQEEGSNLGSGK
jgi:pilus assembly protein CpaE